MSKFLMGFLSGLYVTAVGMVLLTVLCLFLYFFLGSTEVEEPSREEDVDTRITMYFVEDRR